MGNHITHSDTAVIKKTILRDQRATAHFAAKLNMTQGPIRAPLRLLGIGPFVPLQVIRRRSTNHQDNVCSSVCSHKNHPKNDVLPHDFNTFTILWWYFWGSRVRWQWSSHTCTTGGKALCWASSPTPFRCKGWGLLSEYVSADLYVNYHPWRIHGAAIYGNMDPINIPPMLAKFSKYTIHGSYGSWCKHV